MDLFNVSFQLQINEYDLNLTRQKLGYLHSQEQTFNFLKNGLKIGLFVTNPIYFGYVSDTELVVGIYSDISQGGGISGKNGTSLGQRAFGEIIYRGAEKSPIILVLNNAESAFIDILPWY